MWRIWMIFGVIDISFGTPLLGGLQNGLLKCLMLPKSLNTCDFREQADLVPKRLQDLYEKLLTVKSKLGSDQYALSFDMIDSVPLSYIYLLPSMRLNDGTKYSVSDVLRKAVTDDSLALKLMSTLKDNSQLKYFLHGLSEERMEGKGRRAQLSPEVEKTMAGVLAERMPSWSNWQQWLYTASEQARSPLYVSLPNHYFAHLPLEGSASFLFHLRTWVKETEDVKYYDAWSTRSVAVKRIWAVIAVQKAEPPERWSPRILRQMGFLLTGATAEELSRLPSDLKISPSSELLLLELNFDRLQSRSVYDVLYGGVDELTKNDFSKVSRQLMNFLPRQLVKFDVRTVNFGWFNGLDTRGSLSTEKQMLESLIAHNVIAKKLPGVESTTWNNDISSLGKLIHVLPPSRLQNLSSVELSTKSLSEIDSESISYRQARYLTRSGAALDLQQPSSIKPLTGLLKSMSALSLTQLRIATAPSLLVHHLIGHLPGDSVASSSALLEKFRSDIHEENYLTSMLNNPNFNQYFNLLGSRDVAIFYSKLTDNLGKIALTDSRSHFRIRSLPNHVLSVLLTSFRNELETTDGDTWTWDGLFNSTDYPVLRLFVSGLSCRDILKVEPADVLPVIGYYVREKRELGQVFPKNMQYCFQKAVTNYLGLKAELRNVRRDVGLLDLLEPFEVKAVGGYIWSSLTVEDIASTKLKTNILSEIGGLSLEQLLTATGGQKISHFADSYMADVNQVDLGLREMNELGNLIWFLDENIVPRLVRQDFRLFLESFEPDQARILCVPAETRRVWSKLITDSFGEPYTWSSSTLATLGDLMLVFDHFELDQVNVTSWLYAGDVLTARTSLYRFLEWPGKVKPVSFLDVCKELLGDTERENFESSAKTLLRFYAEAAQAQLDTVTQAVDILKASEEVNTLFEKPHVRPVSPSWPLVPTTSQETSSVSSTTTTTRTTTSTPETTTEEEDLSDWYDDMENTSTSYPIVEDFVTRRRRRRRSENEGEKKKERKFKKHFHKNGKKIYKSGDSKTDSVAKEELAVNNSRSLIVEVVSEDANAQASLDVQQRENKKLSCDALKMLGKSASLILTEDDVRRMSVDELEDCSEVLGSFDLPISLSREIWKRLEFWKTEGSLLEVGGLVTGLTETDLLSLNLSLSNAWTLENLAVLSRHVTEPELMSLIADRFILDNADISYLTVDTLVSLGRLVCAMNPQILHKLLNSRPSVFMDSAIVLGSSLQCDGSDIINTCISSLAELAKHKDAFGETSTWSAEDVTTLGAIVAGLPIRDWKNGLKSPALTGLTPAAVQCIPPKTFKELTEHQLSRLPPLSASVVSTAQISYLSPSQTEMIDRVRRQIPDVILRTHLTSSNTGSSNHIFHSKLLFVIPFVTYVWQHRTFLSFFA